MVFVIGTNHPPVTYPIAMIATNGVPSSTNVFSGAGFRPTRTAIQ